MVDQNKYTNVYNCPKIWTLCFQIYGLADKISEKCICYLQLINNVIINKTKVILPKADVILAILFRPFGFIAPKTVNYLAFRGQALEFSVPYEDYSMNESCVLNVIYTFLLLQIDEKKAKLFHEFSS